uniref:Uncharacterized protein n=1 Tax=viral metagenome TaxID=1070528 RepID=A0A6C0ESQ7_9ZZZZ
MDYFIEDAISEMAHYFLSTNELCRIDITKVTRKEFTDDVLNKMFKHVFNSLPKFENLNVSCFNYIDNSAAVLYEMIMTLKENNYSQGDLNQTFNNYWFYVGSYLLNKKKEDTISRILGKVII